MRATRIHNQDLLLELNKKITFAYRASVKSVIYHVFNVFALSNLFHKFIFISVHSSQVSDVIKEVLKAIGKLESIHVAKPVLHMTVNY